MLGVEVVDPRDLELPDVGDVVLHDPESGRTREFTTTPQLRADFARVAAEHRVEVQASVYVVAAHRSCPCTPIGTGSPTSCDSSRHAGTVMVPAPELGAFVRESFRFHRTVVAAVPRVVIAALVVGYVLVQKQRAKHTLRFTNFELLEKVAPSRPGRWRHIPAHADGRRWCSSPSPLPVRRPIKKVPRNRATVILVIDVSLSMQATDVEPTRLAAAQEAAKSFADGLTPGINLGSGRIRRNRFGTGVAHHES